MPGQNYYVTRGPVDFKVGYTETFITDFKLYYKSITESQYHAVSLTCPNGEEQECVKSINLNTYPEMTYIEYYFAISDSYNTVQSPVTTFQIDSATAANPILITSPGDGATLGSKTVILKVLPNLPMQKVYRKVDNGPWSSICTSNCNAEITKSLSLSDGSHTIYVKGLDSNDNEYYDDASFIVDSKAPKIKSEDPGRNDDYATGTFTVRYDEDYLQEFIIHFRKAGQPSYSQASRTDCPSGRSQTCSITINVAPYEGETLEYYYELKDKVTSTVSKYIFTGAVDSIPPEMDVNTPEDYDIFTQRQVGIDIGLNEQVSKLDYEVNSNGRWMTLCSNCGSYTGTKSFNEGENYVVFRARDDAGNIVQESVIIYIDTKVPKIRSVVPDDDGEYTNNQFTITYDEDNLVQAKVYARKVGAASFSQFTSYACPSGRTQTCIITAASPPWTNGDQIEYYMELLDIAGNTKQSETLTVNVDTVPPVILTAYMQQYGSYFKLMATLDGNYYAEYKLDEQNWRKIATSTSSIAKTISSSSGTHTLILRVNDLAGNIDTETLTFTK